MPLRGLPYFSRLYMEYVKKYELNMYGSTLLYLPLPQYVIFYNGMETRPERENLDTGFTPEKSVDMAVERCLREDIMTEVLRVHRKEVVTMFLEDCDEDFYKRAFRKEGYDEGFNAGENLMAVLTQKLLYENRLEDLTHAAADSEFRAKLFREYGLL